MPKVIASRLMVATSTVYAWLSAFLHKGEAALEYGPKPGRPARLSQPQLERLKAQLLAGPSECGYTTGMWNAALVAQLIAQEFGQTFHPRYVSALLGKLGFSYQKARFESDHLDPVRRAEWLEKQWPSIVKQAQGRRSLTPVRR